MRLGDLLFLPFDALWQQKGRTILTTLGVVFGAFVLAASLSVNHGVQQMIVRESQRTDALRRINVHRRWQNPSKAEDADTIDVPGKMSEEKRERIRRILAAEPGRTNAEKPAVLLTHRTLQQLSTLEHVQRVEPRVNFWEFAHLNGRSFQVSIDSTAPDDRKNLRRIVSGRFFDSPDESSAVVSEILLYRSGIVDDDAVEAMLGGTLKLEIHPVQRPQRESLRVYFYRPHRNATTPVETELMARINQQLPSLVKQLNLTPLEQELLQPALEASADDSEPEKVLSREFTIVGVIRRNSEEEESERNWWDVLGSNADVLLPYQTAADFFFASPSASVNGLDQTMLVADHEDHVKQIARQVNDMGLQAHAPIEFIERERMTWQLVFGGMTCIAAVALLVAAMGIANTMLMSVLERTREIGIMKSVGASSGQIQVIFLIEGLLIGAAGGVIGVLLALVASIPGDAWVRAKVERSMNLKIHEALFVFPPWLIMTVILFAILVTTLAAVYPARRAANIDPVMALRHE